MTGPDEVDALVRRIREGAPDAVDLLAALPSPCVVDAEGQSPFNVAIQAGNEAIVALLLANDDALEFAPAVHPADRVRLMKTIYSSEGIDDLELAALTCSSPSCLLSSNRISVGSSELLSYLIRRLKSVSSMMGSNLETM